MKRAAFHVCPLGMVEVVYIWQCRWSKIGLNLNVWIGFMGIRPRAHGIKFIIAEEDEVIRNANKLG